MVLMVEETEADSAAVGAAGEGEAVAGGAVVNQLNDVMSKIAAGLHYDS